jgi:glycosyltransferase involved in cell wall biosynthesis
MARVVAVTMVRDEQDVIGHTISHLLAEGVDHVLVADNLSTDHTRQVLEGFRRTQVTVVDDDDPGYYQNTKMTGLCRRAAAELDAEWVLPFDADEVWYWSHGTLAEFFAQCQVDVVTCAGWDHIATDDDPIDANPYRAMTQRRIGPQRLGKVAFRFHPDATVDFGNHYVFDHPGPTGTGPQYRHFQYRSFEQMVRKVRQGKEAYDATDLHPTYGAHWRELGALSDDVLWAKWRRLCEERGLIHDPAPIR